MSDMGFNANYRERVAVRAWIFRPAYFGPMGVTFDPICTRPGPITTKYACPFRLYQWLFWHVNVDGLRPRTRLPPHLQCPSISNPMRPRCASLSAGTANMQSTVSSG